MIFSRHLISLMPWSVMWTPEAFCMNCVYCLNCHSSLRPLSVSFFPHMSRGATISPWNCRWMTHVLLPCCWPEVRFRSSKVMTAPSTSTPSATPLSIHIVAHATESNEQVDGNQSLHRSLWNYQTHCKIAFCKSVLLKSQLTNPSNK